MRDDDWGFDVPDVTLVTREAEPRVHDLREVITARRYLVRTGGGWRSLPNDVPPWSVVNKPTQWRLNVGAFAAMVPDLRAPLRLNVGRTPEPSAAT